MTARRPSQLGLDAESETQAALEHRPVTLEGGADHRGGRRLRRHPHPGYDRGPTPYGVWTVTKVYVDRAWRSSASQDDDFAFLRVSNPSSSIPVEDETGAEKLATGTHSVHQMVQVIGSPNATNQPITCQNWLREPMAGQLEFDCAAYTNGASGGPFLSQVDPSTGQGLLTGVIGGYQQGGDTPQVSYSSVLGSNAAALCKRAVAGG
ncbi:MAG TPA: hypothetical protein VFV73_20580 [Streptosporangiaceae bacterium]|nr:hypothetical protein [Streptosporangiaceae bacterium]